MSEFGEPVESSKSKLYLGLSINASLVSVYFGYQISVINQFVPSLQDYTESGEIANACVVIAIPFGAILGVAIGNSLLRRLGRRGSLQFNNII
jgi:hypothetical protein